MKSVIVLCLVACSAAPRPNAAIHGEWSVPVAPFQLADHVYFVGAKHISAFLVTTPDGNILIDSGTREMEHAILAATAKLGGVKILLATHAHFDHVGSHAAIQRATGARVMMMRGDAVALETGVDRSPLHGEGWAPVHVDRALDDGDRVELGGVTLEAIAAPGHTPGCTVWLIHTTQTIAIYGCARPNDGVTLTPALIAQTRATFARMRTLAPDVAFVTHPDDPSELLHPKPWADLIDEAERDFAKR